MAFHQVAPSVASDIDALNRLQGTDQEISDSLQTLYCKVSSESKSRILTIFRTKYSPGVPVAVLTEGCSEGDLRHIKNDHRVLEFQLSRGDESELRHFGAVMELVNDKFQRIDRGRPFINLGLVLPSVGHDITSPFISFKVCVP